MSKGKFFQISADFDLNIKPRWLDDFRSKYDLPYGYHITLKTTTSFKSEDFENLKTELKTISNSHKPFMVVFNEFLDGELRGRECHGFQAFPKFGAGSIDFEGEPEVLREEDNLLYIDGKKNLGQIVCAQYVPQLIEKTKKNHVAMMGIFNMHSYLMPGTYARMAAEYETIIFK